MARGLSRNCGWTLILVVAYAGGIHQPARAGMGRDTRAATVGRGIELTGLADYWEAAQYTVPCGLPGATASFAPDGKQFVVVLRRGDLRRDLNEYTLLRWRTDNLGMEGPQILLRMKSSSARPAIDPESISWAPDGRAITFLGEQPGDRHQVFQLDLETGLLRKLTGFKTDVVSYSGSADGRVLAYQINQPIRSLWNAATARTGLAVTSQSLREVSVGKVDPWAWDGADLLTESSRGTTKIAPLAGSDFEGSPVGAYEQNISMAPSGKYLVAIETMPASSIPRGWSGYDDYLVQDTLWSVGAAPHRVETGQGAHDVGGFSRYVLVDTESGRSRVLVNSPVIGMAAAPVVWAPNGRSVILSNVLLPVDMPGASQAGRMAIEVDVDTGKVTPVSPGCYLALSWKGNTLRCAATPDFLEAPALHDGKGARQDSCRVPEVGEFVKARGDWQQIGRNEPPKVNVSLQESMNTPPRLYYRRAGKHTDRLLLDLNPQLEGVRLAREVPVTWDWSRGRSISGGLYYPIHYKAGRRYPLVIQTHDFRPQTFAYFGPYPTAFAAQPLAAHDMFVLQVPDIYVGVDFMKDRQSDGAGHVEGMQRLTVENAVKVYRSAIAHLASEGLVDSRKVGIIGFSATCFYVDWALTHDPGLFAAASVTEGGDGSDLEYMLQFRNEISYTSLYDGPPFGRYLGSWAKLSPIFNLDRVRAPLLIGVTHNELALSEWEWLDGLRDLGRPVYMVVLDGRSQDEHMLQEPWNRRISTGTNVDWFDFWLNGHEDPDPAKRPQYVRWEHLRVNEGRRPAPHPPA